MIIKVKDLIGDYCTEYPQGDQIFAQIKKALESSDSVDLDMEGVQLATSAFFNAALGPLYGSFPKEFLRSKMKFSHLTKEMNIVINRSLEAAKHFYEEQKSA